MPRAKWSTKPNEITAQVTADGEFTVRAPLYDGKDKQGTLIWMMTDQRQMTIVFEQAAGTTPIDFSGGAWVKVV